MPYADPAKYAQYQRHYQNRRQRRLREEWLKANGPCKRCGATENLECDHIDRTTKDSHRIWSWSNARREAELAKCQVLCHECHLTKTMAENRIDPSYRRAYEKKVYVGAA
jgi:hypothetical protein